MSMLVVDWSALVVRLGFTLAHFLWEGAAVGIVLRVFLAACRSARARYNWSLGAMAAMAAAPIVTFCMLGSGGAQVSAALVRLNVPGQNDSGFAWTYVTVAAWAAGASLLALRTGAEFLSVERLRRRAGPLPTIWLQRCETLATRVSARLRVAFAQSHEIAGPIVIGFLKPMILIPSAALMSMPADQLEALILHELAHVRRFDAIANLVQTVVEILLFYHPAVWWVSRTVRQEREHCCDDIAVGEIGDPADFVRALQSLADLQRTSLAMAASGGSLATRVRRLLAVQASPKKTDVRAVLLAIVPLAAAMLGYSAHASVDANRNAAQTQAAGNRPAIDARSSDAVFAKTGRLPAGPVIASAAPVYTDVSTAVAKTDRPGADRVLPTASTVSIGLSTAASGPDDGRNGHSGTLLASSRSDQDPLQAVVRRLYAPPVQSSHMNPLHITVYSAGNAQTTVSLRPFSVTGAMNNILFLLDGQPSSAAALNALPPNKILGVEGASAGSPGAQRYGASPNQSFVNVFTRPPG
jgi:beta-lactamase regulating signal transducer with metallopeptidase domain